MSFVSFVAEFVPNEDDVPQLAEHRARQLRLETADLLAEAVAHATAGRHQLLELSEQLEASMEK
jgi:hypothetical protein